MILHGASGIASFVMAVIAESLYNDHPRMTLAWTSVPLAYMLWVRFAAALVSL